MLNLFNDILLCYTWMSSEFIFLCIVQVLAAYTYISHHSSYLGIYISHHSSYLGIIPFFCLFFFFFFPLILVGFGVFLYSWALPNGTAPSGTSKVLLIWKLACCLPVLLPSTASHMNWWRWISTFFAFFFSTITKQECRSGLATAGYVQTTRSQQDLLDSDQRTATAFRRYIH